MISSSIHSGAHDFVDFSCKRPHPVTDHLFVHQGDSLGRKLTVLVRKKKKENEQKNNVQVCSVVKTLTHMKQVYMFVKINVFLSFIFLSSR